MNGGDESEKIHGYKSPLYTRRPVPGQETLPRPVQKKQTGVASDRQLTIAPHALSLYQFPGAFGQWYADLELVLTARDDNDLSSLSSLASGEIPVEFMAAFDSMELALGDKLDYAVKIIRTWETQERAARGEAEAIARLVTILRTFAAARERRVDGMKALIIRALEAARMRSWDGQTWKVWIQSSPQSVRFTGDVDALPDNLVRVTRSPDMDAAKKIIADGEIPDGFEVTQGQHLRIK